MSSQANRNILPDLSAKDKEIEALKLLVAKLAAANAAKSAGKLTLKVSAKGALSIYGMGRWPVTLYLSQFDRLNSQWSEVCQFVEDHRTEFSTQEKPD